MRRLVCILLSLSVLVLLVPAVLAEGIFVTKTDLPDDFVIGADISSVLSLENSGVHYYSEQNEEADLFALLSENGWKSVRVRIWVDPYDEDGNSYGGGGADLKNACEIGRRAAEHGLSLLVDFHYSDFWADPSKQQCPKAWEGLNMDEKADALYAYTLDALEQLKAAGADILMVQVGNETDNAMAGETSWTNIARLITAGTAAVRKALPGTPAAVHFSQPKADYARILQVCRADYDVFCASYYPYWHGSLQNMIAQLSAVTQKYGKKTMIAETAYPYTLENGDFHSNSVPATGAELKQIVSVQGQANALSDVIRAAAQAGCLGVYVWEIGWLPAPGDTFEAQSMLWEKYGSGWASSFAASYDPFDAGVWYGGSSWDNQALFDLSGKALPTLRLPLALIEGESGPIEIDGYDTPHVVAYLAQGIDLPKTVDAIYTDGSRAPVNVVWDELLIPSVLGEYTITGVAQSGDLVSFLLTVTAQNALQNPGFEDEDMSMYQIDVLNGEQVYRTKSVNDTKTGEGLLHFFDQKAVTFTIEQTVTNLTPGLYSFSLYIHGGDVNESDMTIYAKVNGETVQTATMGVTKWREWQHPVIENIAVKQGDTVSVGAYVKVSGTKPWGKLDDWMLALK